MKIIKQGNINWSTEVLCKGCQSVLEIEASDLIYTLTDQDVIAQQYNSDIIGTVTVICPLCETVIKVKNVPPKIMKTLELS